MSTTHFDHLMGSKLVGHDLALREHLDSDLSMVGLCRDFAFHPSAMQSPVDGVIGFSCGEMPYSPEIALDSGELAYVPLSSGGVSLVFIRTDDLVIPRSIVKMRAAEIAARNGQVFKHMRGTTKKDYLDLAIEELAAGGFPKTTRIHPVVVFPDHLWVAGSGDLDSHVKTLLWKTFGAFDERVYFPDVNREMPPSWVEIAGAVLSRCLEHATDETMPLDVDLMLYEVRTKSDSFRCQAEGCSSAMYTAAHRKVIEQAIESGTLGEIRKLVFILKEGGEETEVVVQEAGVVSTAPPPSKGGLAAERVIRRFRDARSASERVVEAIEAAYREIKG